MTILNPIFLKNFEEINKKINEYIVENKINLEFDKQEDLTNFEVSNIEEYLYYIDIYLENIKNIGKKEEIRKEVLDKIVVIGQEELFLMMKNYSFENEKEEKIMLSEIFNVTSIMSCSYEIQEKKLIAMFDVALDLYHNNKNMSGVVYVWNKDDKDDIDDIDDEYNEYDDKESIGKKELSTIISRYLLSRYRENKSPLSKSEKEALDRILIFTAEKLKIDEHPNNRTNDDLLLYVEREIRVLMHSYELDEKIFKIFFDAKDDVNKVDVDYKNIFIVKEKNDKIDYSINKEILFPYLESKNYVLQVRYIADNILKLISDSLNLNKNDFNDNISSSETSYRFSFKKEKWNEKIDFVMRRIAYNFAKISIDTSNITNLKKYNEYDVNEKLEIVKENVLMELRELELNNILQEKPDGRAKKKL